MPTNSINDAVQALAARVLAGDELTAFNAEYFPPETAGGLRANQATVPVTPGTDYSQSTEADVRQAGAAGDGPFNESQASLLVNGEPVSGPFTS